MSKLCSLLLCAVSIFMLISSAGAAEPLPTDGPLRPLLIATDWGFNQKNILGIPYDYVRYGGFGKQLLIPLFGSFNLAVIQEDHLGVLQRDRFRGAGIQFQHNLSNHRYFSVQGGALRDSLAPGTMWGLEAHFYFH